MANKGTVAYNGTRRSRQTTSCLCVNKALKGNVSAIWMLLIALDEEHELNRVVAARFIK